LFYLQETQTLSSQDLVKKSLLYQNAMRSLQASIDLNPLDARSYFEYGQIISDLAEDDNLISSLDVDRMDIKGGRQGFYNLAKVYYRNAILHEPTNAIYHQRLGSLLDKMGVTEEAEREFGKAVILDKQNVSIHIYLAQYFLSKGRVAQFNTHLNKVKELDISGGGWLGDLVSGFLKKIETEDLVK
jgi:tetratricopeptide (TPR) repeat protein